MLYLIFFSRYVSIIYVDAYSTYDYCCFSAIKMSLFGSVPNVLSAKRGLMLLWKTQAYLIIGYMGTIFHICFHFPSLLLFSGALWRTLSPEMKAEWGVYHIDMVRPKVSHISTLFYEIVNLFRIYQISSEFLLFL